MKRSLLLSLFLAFVATVAIGQTTNYGPAGISPSIPILPIGPIQVTPQSTTIPSAPSVTVLPIKAPLTTIPTTQAVPPPIEPSPTERMENALRMYANSAAPATGAGSFAGIGVTDGAARVQDGTNGRSLGEIAREKRACTPSVTGRTFSNEDFERLSGAGEGNSLPTLVVNACPAGKTP